MLKDGTIYVRGTDGVMVDLQATLQDLIARVFTLESLTLYPGDVY